MMTAATAIAVALLVIGPAVYAGGWLVMHRAIARRAADGDRPIHAMHERRGAFLAGFLATGLLATVAALRALGLVRLEPPASTFLTDLILTINAVPAALFLWHYYRGHFGRGEE